MTSWTSRNGSLVRNLPPAELLSELALSRGASTRPWQTTARPRVRSARRVPRTLAVLAALTALIGSVTAATVTATIPPPPADTLCNPVAPNVTQDSLEVANKNTSARCITTDGAIVDYFGSSSDKQSSGTGLFDPFVRLQGGPTEKGYNTDGTTQFETKPGQWTHAILVSAIPVVDCDGAAGGPSCWELFVDINEGNNSKHISLNKVEIYFGSTTATPPNANLITGYPFTTPNPAGTSTALQYAFDGVIKINDVNQGSGRGDLRYLVPLTNIPTPPAGTYFILYSEWGAASGTYVSDGGFEEWKVRKAPGVSIVKTADAVSVNAGSPIGFTITVTNTGAADATGVTVNDALPSGTDIDWSIASQSPLSSCAISGAPPTETLTCGPLTLASGGGQLTVHVTSPTTGNSCGLYNNEAFFTSTNAGSGSDTAAESVLCGAIRIAKNSTKGGAVANAGAVFAVDGPDAGTTADFSVTDDITAAAPDEDADIGEICVSGLVPGATYTVNETSAPGGYGGASQSDVTVVAVAGDCSTATLNTATFSNSPLYDLQVNFRDGGSGETSATISCTNTGTADTTAASGWDSSNTYLGEGAPETVVCTITVDP